MIEIVLPRLAGTREAAQRLVAAALAVAESDNEALISARLLSTATASFADELVRLLQTNRVTSARVEGAPPAFANLLRASAARRKYSGVRILKDSDLLSA